MAYTMRFVLTLISVALSCDLTAATITVCPSGCDETNVRDAVSAAATGDIVFIHPGTYVDPAAISLDKAITVRGSGATETVLRGGNTEPVLRVGSIPSGGQVLVEDLAIENGRAFAYGGGIEIYTLSSTPMEVNISRCSIRSNYAPSGGGGIGAHESQNLTLTVEATEFHSNFSGSDGGAILFWCLDSTLVLSDSRVIFNYTGSYGGGISVQHATFNMDTSVIRQNFNYYLGGGVYLWDVSAVINESLIAENEADRGGGIAVIDSDVFLTNSTIAKNSAVDGDGGGIFNDGEIDISFSTIAQNTSSSMNGMGIENVETATLTASILSNPGGNSCEGLFSSGGYNIDEDGSCGLSEIGDISGVSAGLEGFVDTGDHRGHFKPRYSSVAIDHADLPVVPEADQRGQLRPQDGNGDGVFVCDSGSIERFELLFADGYEDGTPDAWAAVFP